MAVVTLMAWPATEESEPSIQHQHLGAHLVKKLVRIIHRDFDADAAFAGDDGVGEVVIAFHEADQVKSIRIAEPVEQLAAFAAAVCVVDDGC